MSLITYIAFKICSYNHPFTVKTFHSVRLLLYFGCYYDVKQFCKFDWTFTHERQLHGTLSAMGCLPWEGSIYRRNIISVTCIHLSLQFYHFKLSVIFFSCLCIWLCLQFYHFKLSVIFFSCLCIWCPDRKKFGWW
jgi:hypothetical protein